MIIAVTLLLLNFAAPAKSPKFDDADDLRRVKREVMLPVLKNLPAVILLEPGISASVFADRGQWPSVGTLREELDDMIELELKRTGLTIQKWEAGKPAPWETESRPPVFAVRLSEDNVKVDKAINIELELLDSVKILRNEFSPNWYVSVYKLQQQIPSKGVRAADIKDAVRILLTEFCLDWTKVNPKSRS